MPTQEVPPGLGAAAFLPVLCQEEPLPAKVVGVKCCFGCICLFL